MRNINPSKSRFLKFNFFDTWLFHENLGLNRFADLKKWEKLKLTLTLIKLIFLGMDYKKIISDSWAYTQENKKLIRWFGFIPAVFTTTFSVGYIFYQFFAFKKSYLFNEVHESFFEEIIAYIWRFIQDHVSWSVPLIIFVLIFYLLYFLTPTVSKAGAIEMIARESHGQKVTVPESFAHGLKSFLPLVEFHAVMKVFSISTIFFSSAFILRNARDLFVLFTPVFLIMFVIGIVMSLIFVYSELYIIIDKQNVFAAMKKSAKMVISHWKHTFLITILMIIIGIRVIIQALIVFLVPILIILITGYLAIATAPIIGFIVGGIFGVTALMVAAYLNGVVDVFSYTVWTNTFLKLSSKTNVGTREAFKDDI